MKRNNRRILLQILIPLLFIAIVIIVYTYSGKMKIDQGKRVYEKHCANCHGNKGEGLKKLIPPLTDTAYLKTDQLVCIIKFGISGPLNVKNSNYEGIMPSNNQIENDEIVAVINYIYQEINNINKSTNLPEVNSMLARCYN